MAGGTGRSEPAFVGFNTGYPSALEGQIPSSALPEHVRFFVGLEAETEPGDRREIVMISHSNVAISFLNTGEEATHCMGCVTSGP